jgi:hypothetical protein
MPFSSHHINFIISYPVSYSYRIPWTQNPTCLLSKFSKILFNIVYWANFQNTNVGDKFKFARNGEVTPQKSHYHLRSIHSCTFLEESKLNSQPKYCIMHAPISISISTSQKLFETPPNHPTNHSSTTTTPWSNCTVAAPLPLVF